MLGGGAIKEALIVVTLVLCCRLVSNVNAQTVDTPVAHFVETLVHAKGPSLWESDPKDSPSGGYLFRFELPADGNGSLLQFVTSSLNCQDAGCDWAIYWRPGEGGFKQVRDSFFLPSSAVSKSEFEGKFVYSFLLLNRREGNELDTLSCEPDGSLKTTSRKLTPEELNILSDSVDERPSDERLAKAFDSMERLQKTIVPRQIEKVLLSSFQRDPGISWTPVNIDLPLSEQYRDTKTRKRTETSSPSPSETPN
jgi:hypothetical protein